MRSKVQFIVGILVMVGGFIAAAYLHNSIILSDFKPLMKLMATISAVLIGNAIVVHAIITYKD